MLLVAVPSVSSGEKAAVSPTRTSKLLGHVGEKSPRLETHPVHARNKVAEDILAQRRADGFALHIAFLIRGRHGNAMNDGPRGVEYVALDVAAFGLGAAQGGAGQDQNHDRRQSPAATM